MTDDRYRIINAPAARTLGIGHTLALCLATSMKIALLNDLQDASEGSAVLQVSSF